MKKALVFIATALIGVAAMAQPKFAHVSLSELIQLMPEADDEQLDRVIDEAIVRVLQRMSA